MTRKSNIQVLDDASRIYVPDDLDLFPQIAGKIKKREDAKMMSRPKIAIATLLIVLAFVVVLISVPSVANAMSRWFGFIPGAGIVEQDAPLRVLAAPVTVTRNGITITVKEAVLSIDKTVINYTESGIPANAYPQQENVVGCYTLPNLQLPDGTLLKYSTGAGGHGSDNEFQDVFSGVPANTNDATFILPCISGTLPGTVPENWSLSLHFVPAPPDLTVVPVIEVSPVPSPSPESTGATTTQSAVQPLLTLDKVVALGDGYTFVGSFHSINLPNGITIHAGEQTPDKLKVTDANGQEIHGAPAQDILFPASSMDNFPWAFKIMGKQFAWPLTITLDSAQVTLPDQEVKIQLDTGASPHVDQQWVINKDIETNGYQVRLVSIRRIADGYEFALKTGPGVISVGTWFDGFQSTGGGGQDDGQGNMTQSDTYDGTPPSGKLTAVVSIQMVRINGPWSVTWQPNSTH